MPYVLVQDSSRNRLPSIAANHLDLHDFDKDKPLASVETMRRRQYMPRRNEGAGAKAVEA